MRHQITNHGFIAPRITSDNYVLGSSIVPRDILQADRQWIKSLPSNEKQANETYDPNGCTIWGTLNAIEMLVKKTTGVEENYADILIYILSRTEPPGNDPHEVAETIRKNGLVLETDLPFTPDLDSLSKIYLLEKRVQSLLPKALEWLSKYSFLHEYVFNTNIPFHVKKAKLIDALQLSPICVSVRAWLQRENGLYYKDIGDADTHWCVCVGYKEGEYWIIFDSYPTSEGEYIKKLEWDYDFGFAKRYYLSPRPVNQGTNGWWKSIINFIKGIFTKHI